MYVLVRTHKQQSGRVDGKRTKDYNEEVNRTNYHSKWVRYLISDKHALIIDDDRANRAIWELVLGENGYDVNTADSITAGMTYVSDDITLYLVDYHLPDGRGVDVVSYVRQHFPSCIVVMVSMDDDADVIREAIRAGGMSLWSSPPVHQ